MRRINSLLIILLVLVALLMATSMALLQETETYPRDTGAEEEVLSEINYWRIRRGMSPLVRNEDLDFLAMGQAQYVIPKAPFYQGYDFHTDQFGDTVFRRAELYGWPGYDSPDRVLVGEIAAYFPGVPGAINFWQHSPPHKASVENAGFREAGVAVLHYREWTLSYVVFGGRPNVLPIVYDPARNILFLSVDESDFSDGFQPTRVQILNSDGLRIHEEEWLPWSDRMRLPAGATNVITVICSDGILEVPVTVNLYDVRAFPSEATPTPSNTPTIAPTSTEVLYTPTPRPIQPTATVTPSPADSSGFDVKIVYNDQSLTLINQSGEYLNLKPLVIVANSIGQVKTADWLGRFSEESIEEFPPNYCMQAWSYQLTPGGVPLPESCSTLASGRSAVLPGERFWMAGGFIIRYRTNVIASCEASVGECEFDIPR